MAGPIAKAFVELDVDDTKVKNAKIDMDDAGESAGDSFASGFSTAATAGVVAAGAAAAAAIGVGKPGE